MRDVALGVIEPVPINTPVTWCSRMVMAPKHSGEPRRTVDLQALNRVSVRQTHHTRSPFMLASAIPAGKVKFVLYLEFFSLGALEDGGQSQVHLHHIMGDVQVQGGPPGLPGLHGRVYTQAQPHHREHQKQTGFC